MAVATLLLTTLAGLCVHYGATYDERWPHPTGDQLQDDPSQFTGQQVLLFGEVQTVRDDTIVIHVHDDADDVAAELEVTNVDKSVEPGGMVQVYGVVNPDWTMTAEKTVVVNRSDGASTYKYVVSLAGVLLAIGYFCKHWQILPQKLGFEPRTDRTERETDRPNDG
ncbi:OB-fold tRNA/helicase-type nucleic acid binding protein [Natrialba asiatica DSM 12278]|uniref:OB-fold tRNA/helicase-type nucleic acid binding protein n=1 Tax=Natrialba asiatica (strain ATCC 700177 / DSM 12278 / JCM 9576 / FERM P-10747 / NBRC 102637 / 172P1) TaxID=29540 RepID=M0AV37_NATA1|nr:OB-fold tRNA/helicase-type nucleic acid binding protein [Natrialba asiatica DSM 12278]